MQVFEISPAWSRINKCQRTLCVPIGINITHDILKLFQISLAHRHVKLSNNFEIMITIFVPKTSTKLCYHSFQSSTSYLQGEATCLGNQRKNRSEKRVFSFFGRINFSQSNTVLFSFCSQRNESESPSIEKKMEIFCTTECSLCKTLTKINIRSYKYVSHN